MELTTYDIPSLIQTPWVLYDLSRLLKRSATPFATGIDRIDLQVLQTLTAVFGMRLLPIARTGQSFALLDPASLPEWLKNLSVRWQGEEKNCPPCLPPPFCRNGRHGCTGQPPGMFKRSAFFLVWLERGAPIYAARTPAWPPCRGCCPS